MERTCCFHCKENLVLEEIVEVDSKSFCCTGCATVYSILEESGLSDYYSIPDDLGKRRGSDSNSTYKYLDHDDFQHEYIDIVDNEKTFSFYVEGIHCSACLWLLEKLNTLIEGVISSHLDMSTSVLKIHFRDDIPLSRIASRLEQIGYPPHPILTKGDINQLNIKENKQDLMRICVAFACSGNIMLYSLSVYLGAPQNFANYFNFFSFICTVPVVFYCATPFYKNTLRSLSIKRVSIDVPIVLVLIISFILGMVSFVTDFNFYYFDTISTLVFLLLTSRYLLKIVQKKSLKVNQVQINFANQLAHRLSENRVETILAKYVEVGDRLLVKAHETIPVDARVLSGRSFVNNAILTGESEPIRVEANQSVYMGALNLDSSIEITAIKSTVNSRMGEILENIEKKWKQETFFSTLVDKISKYFTLIILILSGLFFFYFLWSANLKQAIDNTFSLLLITCPCALAISTPLALLVGLGVLLKNNIFVKDEQILEKLLKVKTIFFDKTGTLTTGQFTVTLNEADHDFFPIVYSLESRSNHPIGNSVSKELERRNTTLLDVVDFQEIRGLGVQGTISGKTYLIKRSNDSSQKNEIGLYHEGECLSLFSVEDSIQSGVGDMIDGLKLKGYDIRLLSGDKKERVISLGAEIGLNPEDCYYEQSPEEKLKIIEETPNSMMVGDGVNDSAAIQLALVGVAIKGSAESSLKAASIYIAGEGINKLLPVIEASNRIFLVIKRNLFISLVYNILGIYLAFNGIVTPVVAAIFMPLSSLTVVISTLISVNKINMLIKKN